MFASLFRKAQATVDNAVSHIVNRLIVVVPFVVALGFATAAAYHWLNISYGALTASLVLAGVFAAFGAVLALSIYPETSADAQSALDDKAREAISSDTAEASDGPLADIDQELVLKTLASAAPIAVPFVLRNLVKHLPMILAIASAAFVLTRTTDDVNATPSSDLQPAE